jgi:hypothetical protein
MEHENIQPAQKNDQQMVNATIVANGAMLIALQTVADFHVVRPIRSVSRLAPKLKSEVAYLLLLWLRTVMPCASPRRWRASR